MINCNRKSKIPSYTGVEKKHTIHNFNRYNELKNYNEGVTDLTDVLAAFPKVNFRHYVQPTQELPTMSIMDGTNATCTFPMQLLGRRDGKKAVENEGYMFGKIKEWVASDDLKKQWPRAPDYVEYLVDNKMVDEDEEPIDIKCKVSFLGTQTNETMSQNQVNDDPAFIQG